jgi:hypothetical protein
VLIVLGFITELNPTLTVVFVTTPLAPLAGVVTVTVGNSGLVICSRLHPATRPVNANSANDIFQHSDLPIRFARPIGEFSIYVDDDASAFPI